MMRTAIVSALALCGLLAATDADPACPPGTYFGSSIIYYTGQGPHAACVADFDNDGILDVATVSGAILPVGQQNMVTVRLGRGYGGVGNGRLGPPRDFPAGVRPYHVVAADFDEDGFLDLAVANVANAKVSILRGLGGGTFAAPYDYAVGTSPFYLAVGDFDANEVLDLVVVNNGSASVSVLLGNGDAGVGDGTFALHGTYNVLGANPAAVEVGDFNHDGVSDLAVALYGGEVAVLRGNTLGAVWGGGFLTAQKYLVGSGTFGMTQADLTGDGLPDLVTGNNGGNVSVLVGQEIPGNDAAMFTGLQTYPAGTGPALLALADFDQDGRLDVVTTNGSVDSITVLLRAGGPGIGPGSFGSPSRYATVDFPFGLATGDMNEDGHPDLVVTGFNSHDVQVLLGDCAIAPQPSPEPGLAVPYDVPNDQGGAVHLSWLASDFDANVKQTVTGYRVWRRLPPGLFPAAEAARAGGEPALASLAPTIARTDGTTITFWEAIANLPATGVPNYTYDASTERDSLPGDAPYTAFFITAVTANPDVFYDSKPESAYSVDNLAPPMPTPFDATDGAGGVTLRWNVSMAPDRSSYRLYRGTSPTFTPSPATLLASPVDTSFVDTEGDASTHCYRVSAVDVHGNESATALACAVPTVGVPAEPPAFRLTAANPSFGGALSVTFSLASDHPARLEVFDVSGRRVATASAVGVGEHRRLLTANARLSAGVYVILLTQDGRSLRAKTILLP